jgi:hypothetical protein
MYLKYTLPEEKIQLYVIFHKFNKSVIQTKLMVLDSKTKSRICNFVYSKPRTVNEIAVLIQKNWRTADKYIQQIEEEDGCISTRTFREGSRGALKVVEDGKKNAFVEEFDDPLISKEQELVPLLRSVERVLYVFSGNMSWINMTEKEENLIDILEEIAKRNVQVKVVCRVDFASLSNLEKVYAINNKLGKEAIEIRHCKQSLRGFVIDSRIARFKELKLVENYKRGELKKDLRLFVEIFDEDWVNWLVKVFYSLFRTSIDGKDRINQLKKIMG